MTILERRFRFRDFSFGLRLLIVKAQCTNVIILHENILNLFLSFLFQFETVVSSCKEIESEKRNELCKTLAIEEPKNQTDKLFEVILEDTILFPEGGGQV